MLKTKNSKQFFQCILSNDNYTVESDEPLLKGGQGHGFRPHELLEGALAPCINISVRMLAKEHNISLNSVITQVEVEKTESVTIFNYKITLDENLNENDRSYLMNIIDSCAVKQTLSRQIEFKQV